MRWAIEIIGVSLLAAALAFSLAGWHSEHLRLRAETREKADLPRLLTSEQTTDSTLAEQHAQDLASIQQLRHDLNQATQGEKDLTAKAEKAEMGLVNQGKDFTALSTQFGDIKDREQKVADEESQYFQLYIQLRQTTEDQREYIKGLYIDDLALRRAAGEAAYGTAGAPTPSAPVVAGTKISPAAGSLPKAASAIRQIGVLDAPP